MLQSAPEWVHKLRAEADQPPLRERVPLSWGGVEIGDAEAKILRQIAHTFSFQNVSPLRDTANGWIVDGSLTESLARIALAMRDLGFTHVWRNEQLPVYDVRGHQLGSIERAAVRSLGLRTRAVHLVGETSDGHFWVQQRALNKANDPGQWDTLMGGMVTAIDTPESALERETWEEAGFRLDELFSVTWGGVVHVHKPTSDGASGYISERIDWYRATVPNDREPKNQDGEVERFAKVPRESMIAGITAGKFTLEAGLVIAASLGY
jgi:8-oxo-dGTP pyrophosphatase MutT (NUDIX family)